MLEAKDVYQRYASLRDEKGLTDYRVCKDLNINISYMSHWKRGDYAPKVEKMLKIADYFEVPLEYFYRA